MKVAILGTGAVGRALGRGFAGLGYEVLVGTRDPEAAHAQEAAAAIGDAEVMTFAAAAGAGSCAVVATSWAGTQAALEQAGPVNLAGKLVIDATNPLDFSSGTPRLAIGFSTSAGEQVQAWLPEARVVKAFNTAVAALMVQPKIEDGPPTMFICGNDGAAKNEVTEILTRFGWDAVDLGRIEQSRLLEPLAMIMITYAFQHDHWTHAVRLLGR